MKSLYNTCVFLLLSVCLSLTACSDDNGVQEDSIEINTNVTDFDVTLSADWIKRVTNSRGMQSVRLAFQVEPNTDSLPREAVITFSKEDAKQEIKIVQDGYASVSRFTVTHTCPIFNIPLLVGSKLKDGAIQWGDQQTEDYSPDAVHIYNDQQAHTVVVEIRGVEEVQLQDLVGVTEIDLTEF